MTALRCPVCKSDLYPQEKSYACSAGHSFDIARQGYVNLLLSSQRPSKAPGDSAEMIADRRAFLDADHYLPLREYIAGRLDYLQAARAGNTEFQVLDLGCGEGYYTIAFARDAAVFAKDPGVVAQDPVVCAKDTTAFARDTAACAEHTPAFAEKTVACAAGPADSANAAASAARDARRVYGLDIAKPALAIAARRSKAVTWCVGTSRALPFHDRSLDAVLNIFCRPHCAETRRVLKEDGVLLLAGPGIDHLSELRAVLYDSVVKQESHSTEDILKDGFALRHSETLDYEFTLRGAAIGQLARMTPHYWRAPRSGRERLEALAELTTRAQFVIQEFGTAAG